MKTGVVLKGLFIFTLASVAASLFLCSGDLHAQLKPAKSLEQPKVPEQPKVLEQPKTLQKEMPPLQRPTVTVTSVAPQKVNLFQGGGPVVVEVKGANLASIDSVQVTRGGAEAAGIEETLDRSQLPGLLKITLKATSQALPGTGYLLTAFDAGKDKLLEIPRTMAAIDTLAPPGKGLAAPKPAAGTVPRVKPIGQPKVTKPAVDAVPLPGKGLAPPKPVAITVPGATRKTEPPKISKSSSQEAGAPVFGARWLGTTKDLETSKSHSGTGSSSGGLGTIHYTPGTATGSKGLKEQASFEEKMMLWGFEDRLSDQRIQERVAEGNPDKVVADLVREKWGIPPGAADDAGPEDLAEAGAVIMVLGGEVDQPIWWTDTDTAARGQLGIPDDALRGKDLRSLVQGLASVQMVDGDPRNPNIWRDVGTMQDGGMSEKDFKRKWLPTPGGSSSSAGSPGGSSGPPSTSSSDSRADRVPGGASDRAPGAGGGDGSSSSGPPVVAGGTKTSPTSSSGPKPTSSSQPPPGGISASTSQSEVETEIGTVIVSNSTTNPDGSYSYDSAVFDAAGNLLGTLHTVCGGGKCTDTNTATGQQITYDDTEGTAPRNGTGSVTLPKSGGTSSSSSGTASASADASSSSDDSSSSSGDSSSSSEESSSSSDESSSSSDDGSSSSGDSSSGTSGTPLDPDTALLRDNRVGMEAVKAHIAFKRSQTVLPSGESVLSSSATAADRYRPGGDPAPEAPQKGGVSSQTTVGSRFHPVTVDPTPEAAATIVVTSPGSATLGPGSSEPWKCYRRLIKSSSGMRFCLCPVETHPVTGQPIPRLVPAPLTTSASGEDPSSVGGDPAGIEVNGYDPMKDPCKTYTDSEWEAMYPNTY